MTSDVLIIGAGISGLTAATYLHAQKQSFKIIEARSRIGGRAYSIQSGEGYLDAGPAWVWPRYQPQIRRLITEYEIDTLPQYEEGDFLFERANDIRRGQYPKRYGDALRLKDGMQALTKALAADLPEESFEFNHAVSSVKIEDEVMLTTDAESLFSGKALISTVPGPLLHDCDFTPALPQTLANALARWPTWMAAHAKIFARYKRPFWREDGLSGSAVSHVGPLLEVADQSSNEDGLYALFAFLAWPAATRQERAGTLQQDCIDHLVKLFGPEAANPESFHLQDWAQEEFTASESDLIEARSHPPYGEPPLSRGWFDNRLFFAGAETSAEHGGLIEGAITSGRRAARQAINSLN